MLLTAGIIIRQFFYACILGRNYFIVLQNYNKHVFGNREMGKLTARVPLEKYQICLHVEMDIIFISKVAMLKYTEPFYV